MSLLDTIGRWLGGRRWVSAGELRAALASRSAPWVIDVREPGEFSGPLPHVDGAENVPMARLAADPARIAAQRPGRPIVLVCLTDKRSSAAAGLLARAGRPNARVLRGGMKAWTEAGLPVVK